MKRHAGIVLLAAGVLLSDAAIGRADPPDMANPTLNKTWVCRRNQSESNKIGAICTYLHLTDASAGAVPQIGGTLVIWTNRSGGQYSSKLTWDLPTVPVKQSGTGTRKRELVRWDATTKLLTPTAGNTMQIVVYASLYKGKNKSAAHEHRRFLVRCRPMAGAGCGGQAGDCDEEPDDDVLQEE